MGVGLPNITGSTSFDSVAGPIVKTSITSGAIYKGTARSSTLSRYNVAGSDLAFDASRSNPVYGSSSMVTPLSLSCKIVLKY